MKPKIWPLSALLCVVLVTPAHTALPPPPGAGSTGGPLPVIVAATPQDRAILRSARRAMGALEKRLTMESVNLDFREAQGLLREVLFALRGPEGEGIYQYATLARDPQQAFEPLAEFNLGAATTPAYGGWKPPPGMDTETALEATVAHFSDLRLEAPEKRNLWRDNAPVLLRWVSLGHPSAGERPRERLDRWLKPGEFWESEALALDEPVRVAFAAEVKNPSEDRAVLRLSGRPFVVTDDPANPFFPLIDRTKGLFTHLSGALRQEHITALKDGLGQMQEALTEETPATETGPVEDMPPYEKDREISRAVLLNRLKYILSLLEGTPHERQQAREELKRFIQEVEGKPELYSDL